MNKNNMFLGIALLFLGLMQQMEAYSLWGSTANKKNVHFATSKPVMNHYPTIEAPMMFQERIGRAFVIAAAMLTFNAADATAMITPPTNTAPMAITTTSTVSSHGMIDFSSMTLSSKIIETMDFSLPSSYDSIADANANGAAELVSSETALPTQGSTSKKATKAKKSTPDAPTPSMTAEEKAAIAAEKSAQREAVEAQRKALVAEDLAEKQALSAQKKAEQLAYNEKKAGEREAEKESQKAFAANEGAVAREEKRLTPVEQFSGGSANKAKSMMGADFVDMGMPSYGSTAGSSGKKDSPFALNKL